MSALLNPPIQPGETQPSGTLEGNLGSEYKLADLDYASTEAVKPRLTGALVGVRLVKNDSGGVLSPRTCVAYKAGYYGLRIGAVSGAGEVANGVVDPYLTGTVASGDHFLLFQTGPCKIINGAATQLVTNEPLVTAADGEVVGFDPTPDDATEAAVQAQYRVGRAMATIAAVANTVGRAWLDCF